MATPDAHAITRFMLMWDTVHQQKMSRLKGTVKIDQFSGKRKRYSVVEDDTWAAKAGRIAETVRDEMSALFGWLYTSAFEKAKVYDEDDDQLTGDMESITSPLVDLIAKGHNRLCDQVIIDALFASKYTDEDGNGTPVAFPTSQDIAVNYVRSGTPANANLTIDKLIGARSKFGVNEAIEADMPADLYLGCTQSQIDSLLDDARIQSKDTNYVQALVDGTVDRYMGFKFKRTELFPKASDIRSVAAWEPNSVIFNPGIRRISVKTLPEHSDAIQVRGYSRLGALRYKDTGVVRIYCDETA